MSRRTTSKATPTTMTTADEKGPSPELCGGQGTGRDEAEGKCPLDQQCGQREQIHLHGSLSAAVVNSPPGSTAMTTALISDGGDDNHAANGGGGGGYDDDNDDNINYQLDRER